VDSIYLKVWVRYLGFASTAGNEGRPRVLVGAGAQLVSLLDVAPAVEEGAKYSSWRVAA
jgi:hypothetical protein